MCQKSLSDGAEATMNSNLPYLPFVGWSLKEVALATYLLPPCWYPSSISPRPLRFRHWPKQPTLAICKNTHFHLWFRPQLGYQGSLLLEPSIRRLNGVTGPLVQVNLLTSEKRGIPFAQLYFLPPYES